MTEHKDMSEELDRAIERKPLTEPAAAMCAEMDRQYQARTKDNRTPFDYDWNAIAQAAIDAAKAGGEPKTELEALRQARKEQLRKVAELTEIASLKKQLEIPAHAGQGMHDLLLPKPERDE